ncbi:MAG: DUF5716 family protein [Terrimicrobiaceae bacterium]|nr:DUF5716 family protein [Terrimicrobiaceae bacterium]
MISFSHFESDPAQLLSQRLGPLFKQGFFRPLARPSAPVYVDFIDRFDARSNEDGQLSHEETLALIRDTLMLNPSAELDLDEGGDTQDLRLKAGKLFNNLLQAQWIQQRRVSIDERWVTLSPQVRPLIRSLREIAQDDVAELKDFAATIRSICETLLAEGTLDPHRRTPEELRQVIKEITDRVLHAGDQMLALESLVLKYERQQRESKSAGETLDRLLVEFHEGDHMICYDTLQKGGLLPKLKQARLVVQDAISNPFLKEHLAKAIATHKGLTEMDAYGKAEQSLSRLDRELGGLPSKQRIVDGRVADFSRLSAQRYRYQTEVRGRRPEQVKEYLQAAAEKYAGSSFADLARETGMQLLSPEVEIYFGRDALSRPRKAKLPVDLTMASTPRLGDPFDVQEMIRSRNRTSITPQRAARLIEERLPNVGDKITTADFHLVSEDDDLLDLLAVLSFHRANTKGHKLRWRIHSSRKEHGLHPENIPLDRQAGHLIERITIERLA